MKKYSIILVITLCICLAFPSVDCKAESFVFRVGTKDSMLEDSSFSQFDYDNRGNIFNIDNTYFSGWDSQDYTDFFTMSGMPFNPFTSSDCYWVMYAASNGLVWVFSIDLSSVSGSYVKNAVSANSWQFGVCFDSDPGVSSLPYYGSAYNYSDNTWSSVYNMEILKNYNVDPATFAYYLDGSTVKLSSSLTNDKYYFYSTHGADMAFLWSNGDHVYTYNNMYNYWIDQGYTVDANSNYCLACSFSTSAELLNTDYFKGGQVYYFDGTSVQAPEGEVVVESNINHLYLNDFDSGFCKPYTLEDLSRVGGGYVYFIYNFDSWVNSHSSQYELHIITQVTVDGTTTTYPSVRNLDLNGCTVLGLKDLASSFLWENENMLFVEYPDQLMSNYNKGYLYSMTYINAYGVSSDNFISRALSGGGRSNRLFYSNSGTTRKLTSSQPDSTIENQWVGTPRNQFTISFIVTLYDTVSETSSGSFVETHDLVRGTSTVSNNTIKDNSNPFEGYSNDNPYLPIDNSGGGYNTPISYGYVNNINIPSSYDITYRDGVNSFIQWYNQDPSTTGIMNSFWGFMGTFKNNPAVPIYEEYWGFLPSGFKNLIIVCASLGIIGFAAGVLRRRIFK